MKFCFCFFALVALFCSSEAATVRNPPKVQLYSHNPGEFDQPNILICHVSEFHPPDITIRLLKKDKELLNPRQTDLAFVGTWQFHLIHSADFTPHRGEKFICRVEHGLRVTDYEWDPNM